MNRASTDWVPIYGPLNVVDKLNWPHWIYFHSLASNINAMRPQNEIQSGAVGILPFYHNRLMVSYLKLNPESH